MDAYRLTLAATLGVFAHVFSFDPAIAQDQSDGTTPEIPRSTKPLCEQSTLDAFESLQKGFGKDRKAKYDELSSDDSIAVIGAFKRYVNQLERGAADRDVAGKGESVEWFAGFVEGRLKVRCPGWWKDMLRSAKRSMDGTVRFEKSAPWRFVVAANKLLVREGSSLTVSDDGGWSFQGDGGKIQLDSATIEAVRASLEPEVIEVSTRGTRSYVAFLRGDNLGYGLFAFDDRGRKAWSASVWSSLGIHVWQGPSDAHYVEIQEFSDRVAVFGAVGTTVYVEVFDRNTGKPRARFSSRALQTW